MEMAEVEPVPSRDVTVYQLRWYWSQLRMQNTNNISILIKRSVVIKNGVWTKTWPLNVYISIAHYATVYFEYFALNEFCIIC